MSDDLQGTQWTLQGTQWTVLSRSSSLDEFEIVDAEPAADDESAAAEVESAAEDAQSKEGFPVDETGPASDIEEHSAAEDDQSKAGFQVDESGPAADIEERHSESESESEFEEIIMPQAEIAQEDPAPEAEQQEKLSALQVHDEDSSHHSSPSFSCQYFEFDDIDIDSSECASVQLEEPEDGLAVAAEVGSSIRKRRRRSMAPAHVNHLADTMRQNAKDGLSEAVRLINKLDDRLILACPHVVDGATYCTQQVQGDFQSTAKDMKDAFGEGQESEPGVAASFSHFKGQFKNDFKNIRKDVDSAFGCLLGSTGRYGEKTLKKKSIPAATCSLVSVAVASWLVPVRLARFAVANIVL